METPVAGSVHLAVIDESYHPRQLRLTERAREKLAGVALYTVDASCVCPINTFRGARVAGTAAAAVGSAKSRTSKAFSQEEFRKAQVPERCWIVANRVRDNSMCGWSERSSSRAAFVCIDVLDFFHTLCKSNPLLTNLME